MTKGRDHKDGYDRKYLETLIEEATVDCYDEYEQAAGLLTMIQDELDLPFTTRVLGMEVAVSDLPLPLPPPDGAQWIAAYRLWARHGGSGEDRA